MKIALLGTFDVENYGDLLFPLLAERRLQRQIPDLTLSSISPAGGAPVWEDSLGSIGYDEFSSRQQDYRGFLVGGGNIIRVTPSDLRIYDKIPLLGYYNLWAGIAAENNDNSRPICWNAPGVPSSFSPSLRPLLRACLDRVDYVSVRDEPSRNFLREVAPNLEIAIVPDPAWDVDGIWTAKTLDAAYRNAFVSRGTTVPDRSVTIHLNSRYLGGETPGQVASHLDNLCRALQAKGVLIALGPCHGDDELARQVAEHMVTGPLLIDRPASLKEIAACIARSAAFIGSSMHGFITASSFNVPAVVVASPLTVKFRGMLSQIDLPNLLHQTWREATATITHLNSADHIRTLRRVHAGQQKLLDEHWSKIVAFFDDIRSQPLHPPETKREQVPTPGTYSGSNRETLLSLVAMETFAKFRALRKRLREHEVLAEKWKSELRAVNKMRLEHNEQVAGLREKIAAGGKELANKKSTIADQTNVIIGLRAKIASPRKEFAEKKSTIENQKNVIAGLRAKIAALRKELADKESTIKYLGNAGRRWNSILRHERMSGFKIFFRGIRTALYVNPNVTRVRPSLYFHYLIIRRRKDARNLALMAGSGFFDPAYYLEHNKDVAEAGTDPLIHFVDFGAAQGRNPSAFFTAEYYLEHKMDLRLGSFVITEELRGLSGGPHGTD